MVSGFVESDFFFVSPLEGLNLDTNVLNISVESSDMAMKRDCLKNENARAQNGILLDREALDRVW